MKSLALSFLFLSLGYLAFPQLNGTYTVGGSSPDYANLTSAIEDLEDSGISGSVTLSLRNGTYIERIMIPEIVGTSESSRITITSESQDSSLVLLAIEEVHPFDTNYVMFLNGADFITLEGITISGPTGTHTRVLVLDSGAHHVTVKNCVLNGNPDASNSYNHAVLYSPSGSLDSAFVLQNSEINDGGYGLVFIGKDEDELENGTIIEGNTFNEGLGGHYLSFQNNLIFRNNTIITENPSVSFGLSFRNTDNETQIVGNRVLIYGSSNAGLQLTSCDGMADSLGLIANNFVYMEGEDAGSGISISNSTFQNIYHNSVHVAYGEIGTYALSAYGSNLRILNNIFYCSNGGGIVSSHSGAIVAMDYNVLYTTASGVNSFGYLEDFIDNYADWVTLSGFDNNSLNINPLFVGGSNLHTSNPSINGMATPLPEVTVDIDEEIRDVTNPDPGADEFSVPNTDAGIISFDLPESTCSTDLEVYATLKNFGANELTSVTINWSANGVVQTPVNWTGSLNSGAEESVQLDTYAIGFDGHDFEAYSTLPNGIIDPNNTNDTTMLNRYYLGLDAGSYTIGGSSPDFESWNAAVDVLKNGGICGPVVFNVRDGIYEESVHLEQVAGASDINTITFQSESQDSTAVVLTAYTRFGDDFVLHLEGADHVQINQITMLQDEESVFGHVMIINYGAHQNTISSCVLQGVETTETGTGVAVIYSQNDVDSSNVFNHNLIRNGSYGFHYIGKSEGERGTRITNNRLEGQVRRGISIRYQDGIVISGNEIIGGPGYKVGLYVTNSDDSIRVYNNRLSGNFDEYAMLLQSNDAEEGKEGLIYNNFIQATSVETTKMSGIYLASSNYQQIVYNSINITSEQPTSSALRLNSGGSISIFNNLLINQGGGYTLEVSGTAALDSSNHNSLFTTGDVLAYWDDMETLDLADWQSASGQDDMTLNVNPFYTSLTDLHASSSLLDGQGAPLNSVTTDIDGDVRDGTTPDIGADEFITFSLDLGIVSLDSLITGGNCDTSGDVYITLLNFGQTTVTSADISWKVNGVAQSPVNWTGSLSPATTDAVFLGDASFTTPNVNNLEIVLESINGGTDNNKSNDTLRATHFVALPEGTYTIGGDTPDFETFTEVAEVLNNGGVCGPVVLEVRDGIYNEQISIQEIDGSSSNNTITFMSASGDSSAVTLTYATVDYQRNYTLQLFGADYVTLDRIGIQNTGEKFASALLLLGGANQNAISHCLLENPQNIGNVIDFDDVARDTSNIFIGNQIVHGSTGISMEADSQGEPASWNVIKENVFIDQTQNGILGLRQSHLEISDNTITTGDDANDTYNGLYYSSVFGMVMNNRIVLDRGQSGLFLSNTEGTEESRVVVANNCIIAGETVEVGMNIWQRNEFTDILHNSVSLSSTQEGSAVLRVDFSNEASTRVENNHFSHEGTGFAIFLYDTTDYPTMDYNNYYTNGTTFAGVWSSQGNISLADFNAWKNLVDIDANSLNVEVILDDEDCHLCSEDLGGEGNPDLTTATDPDGDLREATVDIGADEFDYGAELPISILMTRECNTALLEAETSATGTFMWSTGATGASIEIDSEDTYDVTITGECTQSGTAMVEFLFDVCPLAVGDPEVISFYPNPTMGWLTLTDTQFRTATVHGLDGKLIKSFKISNHKYLNISDLKAGIYLINLIGPKHTETHKVILK